MHPKLIVLPVLALLILAGVWILMPSANTPLVHGASELTEAELTNDCEAEPLTATPRAAPTPEPEPQASYAQDEFLCATGSTGGSATRWVWFALRYDYATREKWPNLPEIGVPELKVRTDWASDWLSIETEPLDAGYYEARFRARLADGKYTGLIEALGMAPLPFSFEVRDYSNHYWLDVMPAFPRVDFSVLTRAGTPLPAGRISFRNRREGDPFYSPIDDQDIPAQTTAFTHEFTHGPHSDLLKVFFSPELDDWPSCVPSPYEFGYYACGEVRVPLWDETGYATLDLTSLPPLPPTPVVEVDESVTVRDLRTGVPEGWDESDMAGWDYWAPVTMNDKVTSFGYLRCRVVIENDVAHYRFEPPRWVSVCGKAVDPAGQPVQHAEILRPWHNGGDYSREMRCATDKEGEFELRRCTHRALDFRCYKWKYSEPHFSLGSRLEETPTITLSPEQE